MHGENIVKKNNQAWKLTLLLVIFLAPFIIALFVYQARDGLHFMTKNVGALIHPSVAFSTVGTLPEQQHRWWMVYYSDNGCDEACERALNHFETIRESLLKEKDRLGIILITKSATDAVPFKDVYIIQHGMPLPASLPAENGRAIWLVDPLGNVILNYNPVTLDNRLLLDLRHLLKVSQIG